MIMEYGDVRGQTLDGKYKIESQLGKGGMGTVYLATHIGTERPVAVKVIASEFMQRAEFVERFRREARAAGRLRHPNVVDVTDFGFSQTKSGEVAYLVMEYLDGCTLGEILDEEKCLPLNWAVDILEQVCSAVHEAHEQGIIHRDLKPDNIWLEPNQRGGYTVKVLDFGIAKLEESRSAAIPGFEKLPLRASRPTQVIGDKDKETIGDGTAGTRIENNSSTVVSDAQIQGRSAGLDTANSENETIALEAGTVIQTGESDGVDTEVDSPFADTKIIGADDGNTKLVSDQTDRSDKRAETTGKSLLNTPSTAALTRVGAVLGTPLYMSPEQCRGEKLTSHSDIYSLAVIAYQMLEGKTPFVGSYSDVMEAHKETAPPDLNAKKIPKRVKRVINQSLAKNPDERPQTAEGFASELRSNSEGIGVLLQRALVIYSQRLPKLLQIAFLIAIPSILLTCLSVLLRFLVVAEVFPENIWTNILAAALGLTGFFVHVFYSALLVGMTTWIVAQTLAAPLRPISIRATFRQVGRRWKPLVKTVTVSTLLAMIGVIICLLPGIWLSARYMLIAPSIMMEDISGRVAFKRSIELGKRSFRTVLATSVLVYVVPITLALVMTVVIAGMINAISSPEDLGFSDQPAVAEVSKPVDDGGVDVTLGKSRIQINDGQSAKEKSMGSKIKGALQQGIFELLWTPIVILISSFTAVLTALLYFKTRQAGGESMQGLLQKFEEAECSTSKWQIRVRHRLMQSGRSTGGKKFTGG